MVVKKEMNELLEYLVKKLSFLYEKYGARFVDSKAQESNAFLVLELDNFRLRLVRDRSQIFIDIQSNYDLKNEKEWFSYDVISQLISGEVEESAVLDDLKVEFIKEHFDELENIFAASEVDATINKLHGLEKERAKRLFD